MTKKKNWTKKYFGSHLSLISSKNKRGWSPIAQPNSYKPANYFLYMHEHVHE